VFKNLTFWGRFAPIGLLIIAITLGIDQAHKWWMLNVYDIASLQPVKITSFFDLVLVMNPGVSYGLLKGLSPMFLFIGQLLISIFLWFWLTGSRDQVSAFATALIIGGALGNAVDRLLYSAVADFFYLHAFGYSWYVFNLADVAIVAGAGLLVYALLKDMGCKT